MHEQSLQLSQRVLNHYPTLLAKPAEDAIELDTLSHDPIKHRAKEEVLRRDRHIQKRLEKLQLLAEREEMKFSHSVQFNAVPDWSSHYIAYSNFKKLIYTLEKQIHRKPGADGQDEETALLQDNTQVDPDTTFRRLLDSELEKVCSFYRLKELEVYGDLEQLMQDVENYKRDTSGVDMDEVVNLENRRKLNRSASIFGGIPFPRRKRRTSTMSVSVEEEPEENDDSDSDADDNEERSTANEAKEQECMGCSNQARY